MYRMFDCVKFKVVSGHQDLKHPLRKSMRRLWFLRSNLTIQIHSDSILSSVLPSCPSVCLSVSLFVCMFLCLCLNVCTPLFVYLHVSLFSLSLPLPLSLCLFSISKNTLLLLPASLSPSLLFTLSLSHYLSLPLSVFFLSL